MTESGHELLKPAAAARPGDLLQYRAVYSNSGNQPAGHLMASLPVPPGTTLQPGGIEPADAQATVDGSHYAPMPLMRSVIGKDGLPHAQPVPLSEIRALRWDLGTLAPRANRAVQLRVHVNRPIAAPAAIKPASASSGKKPS